jgi:prephenate dehydrogenase
MKVAVLGVGLIGGSIGLAAKSRLGAEVSGFDPDPDTLERAVGVGALDRPAGSVADAVTDAEIVFCAAPVKSLPDLVAEALESAPADAVVSDVGSTKRDLVERSASLPGGSRFIGGHPLAGAETAGVENSTAELLDGARWYLTPTEHSEGVLLDRLHRFLTDLGARPQAIDATEHDRAMAAISHLPHVLANVLASTARSSLVGDRERRPAVGRSFRDSTRVAGANPAIWADIFSANGEVVADEIDAVVARLTEAAELLREGSTERIGAWQSAAAEDRRLLLDSDLAAGPLLELRVAVENRPGIVAEVALALSRAGVNIEDMSLFPSEAGDSGAISLWVGGSAEAERAAEVVRGLGLAVSIAAE